MISDLFGSLLRCDLCEHGVGVHDTRGCLERNCECVRNKEHVIQSNVNLSISEHQSEWRDTTA